MNFIVKKQRFSFSYVNIDNQTLTLTAAYQAVAGFL